MNKNIFFILFYSLYTIQTYSFFVKPTPEEIGQREWQQCIDNRKKELFIKTKRCSKLSEIEINQLGQDLNPDNMQSHCLDMLKKSENFQILLQTMLKEEEEANKPLELLIHANGKNRYKKLI